MEVLGGEMVGVFGVRVRDSPCRCIGCQVVLLLIFSRLDRHRLGC